MKTWTRLLEQLYEHSWNEPLGRFRAPFAFRGLPDIEQLLTNSLTRLLFLEPPALDARIVNQAALFSLMPSPTAPLHEWLRDHPELARAVVVPAELKWEVDSTASAVPWRVITSRGAETEPVHLLHSFRACPRGGSWGRCSFLLRSFPDAARRSTTRRTRRRSAS